MGLVARNPEEVTEEQGSGQLVGSPPMHANGVVHHSALAEDGTLTHHEQRFEGGELVEWRVSDTPGPWALVRPGPPTRPVGTGVASPETVAATGVRIADRLLALPPDDDFASADFARLPVVPDATARLRFELLGTPVGRILCDVRYQDGQRPMGGVVAEWPERTAPGEPAHDAPEMTVRMRWSSYLDLRAGECDYLEAVEDGGDVADTRWTLLLLLHGIVQTPQYVEAYRALPRFPPELRWWGEAARYIPSDAVPRPL